MSGPIRRGCSGPNERDGAHLAKLRNDFSPTELYSVAQRRIERPNRKHPMQNLSPRHVMTEEAGRLGVASGWYSTKVSGTFVSGPHNTEADCLLKIGEINPPPIKRLVS